MTAIEARSERIDNTMEKIMDNLDKVKEKDRQRKLQERKYER